MKFNRKPPEELERELNALREAFRESAGTEAANLREAVARLREADLSTLDEETLFEFQRRAHKLAGRGGTYGFTRLSEVARALEREMDRIIRSDGVVTPREVEFIAEMVEHVGIEVAAIA